MTPNKPTLHPRNRHQGRYDFPALIKAHPDLARFTITNPYGNPSIDFANPEAVRVFNRALLKAQYGIAHWDIPADYLCPPIPGRADYIHVLADLLGEDNAGEVPRGAQVRALDIGVGANCIYPLLGHSDYRWRFVGTDIDAVALASANAIVQANKLDKAISLRLQAQPRHILSGLLPKSPVSSNSSASTWPARRSTSSSGTSIATGTWSCPSLCCGTRTPRSNAPVAPAVPWCACWK